MLEFLFYSYSSISFRFYYNIFSSIKSSSPSTASIMLMYWDHLLRKVLFWLVSLSCVVAWVWWVLLSPAPLWTMCWNNKFCWYYHHTPEHHLWRASVVYTLNNHPENPSGDWVGPVVSRLYVREPLFPVTSVTKNILNIVSKCWIQGNQW